jgi:hypothetical protein
MNLKLKIAALLGMAAMLLAPTAALAEGPTYAPEEPAHHPLPGPGASLAKKTKAYGVYCKSFPKKAVKGQKLTPFNRCVTAMATAASTKKTAQLTCKAFSKEHVKGQVGTEFSRCVTGATKVKKRAAAL